MKWSRKDYDMDSEPRYCMECATPIGPLVVDRAEWIDPDKPWTACWFPMDRGDEVQLGRAATEAGSKRIASHWLRTIEVGIGNALAAGCSAVDGGE